MLTEEILKVLNMLLNKVPQGCFIGKIEAKKLQVGVQDDLKENYAEILKEGELKEQKYFLCQGQTLASDGKIVKIKLSLMAGVVTKVNKVEKNYIEEVNKVRDQNFFSKDEIQAFCNRTGDNNYIHRGEKAVVPGMLIIEKCENYIVKSFNYSLKKIKAEFYSPIYSDEIISIDLKKDKIIGYYQAKKYFQIKYDKEN